MKFDWRRWLTPVGLCVLLLLAGGAWLLLHRTPDNPESDLIVLPEVIEGGPPWLDIEAKTAGKVVCWHVCPAAGNPVIRSQPGDTKKATFGAASAGMYHVFAWTSIKDVPTPAAHTIVKWAGGGPGPGPGPGPNPPPDPNDPLFVSLKTAWQADTAPDRMRNRDSLAGLYRVAGKEMVNDQAIKTVGELYTKLRTARAALMPDDALLGVRKVIEAELDRVLPTKPSVPLDSTTRNLCGQHFARVGDLLGRLL